MNNPFDKKSEPLNHDLFERFFSHIDIVKSRREFVEKIKLEVLETVMGKIKEMTPDLLVNYVDTYKQLTFMINEFDKTIKTIEKKSKKLFESSSLTEDVYKMRDEMKALRKKIDRLNAGLKGFSRISNVLDEDEK